MKWRIDPVTVSLHSATLGIQSEGRFPARWCSFYFSSRLARVTHEARGRPAVVDEKGALCFGGWFFYNYQKPTKRIVETTKHTTFFLVQRALNSCHEAHAKTRGEKKIKPQKITIKNIHRAPVVRPYVRTHLELFRRSAAPRSAAALSAARPRWWKSS